MSLFKTPVPHQPDCCTKGMGGGRERAISASRVFGGIPLSGNFPRLFKNRSGSFITNTSTIIPAVNCLSLAPQLSSKSQEQALGETRSNLWFPFPLCQFRGSCQQNPGDAGRSHGYEGRRFRASPGAQRGPARQHRGGQDARARTRPSPGAADPG